MQTPIKNHTIKEVEDCLGAALSTLFDEKTFVQVDQLELNGAFKQGVRLVIQAHKDRRTPLQVVKIDGLRPVLVFQETAVPKRLTRMVLPKVLPTLPNWWHRQTRVHAAVAKFVLEDGFKPAKAWRLHLKLMEFEVAACVGVTRAVYYNLEIARSPGKRPVSGSQLLWAPRKVKSISEPAPFPLFGCQALHCPGFTLRLKNRKEP